MVSIVQRGFQWPEHTIHSVCYGTAEHVFFPQYILDFVTAQRIITRKSKVMDIPDTLTQFQSSY